MVRHGGHSNRRRDVARHREGWPSRCRWLCATALVNWRSLRFGAASRWSDRWEATYGALPGRSMTSQRSPSPSSSSSCPSCQWCRNLGHRGPSAPVSRGVTRRGGAVSSMERPRRPWDLARDDCRQLRDGEAPTQPPAAQKGKKVSGGDAGCVTRHPRSGPRSAGRSEQRRAHRSRVPARRSSFAYGERRQLCDLSHLQRTRVLPPDATARARPESARVNPDADPIAPS
jgi:hypothetical protein